MDKKTLIRVGERLQELRCSGDNSFVFVNKVDKLTDVLLKGKLPKVCWTCGGDGEEYGRESCRDCCCTGYQ